MAPSSSGGAPRARRVRGVGGWAAWGVLLSPLVFLALLHARARRYATRMCLSVCFPLLRAAARALGIVRPSEVDPNSHTIEDPDLPVWLAGVSSLVAAEERAGKELWEWWLDALSFRADSAGRLHIRQLLRHPDTSDKFRNLFEYLDARGEGALDAESVVRFSAGIQGTVRVLLDKDRHARRDAAAAAPDAPRATSTATATANAKIDIPPATPAEHDFLVQNFDFLFPPEHPLDLTAFLSLAKLVLVRRIVKALVRHHGLHAVRRGMRAPIVVDVVVRDDATGEPAFRVHTVAPSTAPGVEGFRLGAIAESPGPDGDR